ncbi:GNAT family N-acetyltransferase [Arthrobacter sp. FW306-07-I]|uniref:GNAT family N-acetyltransferase n=1 Tax=Arthrobacter sp. FW306-07-I TaxID=2879622 RepID=UPI001F17814D|nr:GNAT family N-acetyltransferase [Arthrobacter sp. FW306-07-I]UKA74585.1 GNAT family N-acetyltransferase [Arthrobacter sp. FW306-07-I]
MTDQFCLWDADNPDDFDSWVTAWEKWPEKEVGAHPGYGKLFKAPGDRFLCAAYITPSNGSVLYPFILRDVPQYLVTLHQEETLRDIITPYGYGGPYAWDLIDPSIVSSQFWKQFDAWATENNVVSEFIRFSLFPHALLPYPGDVISRSCNIVRSLELDDNAMFLSFEKKVRKNVRKAERSGLRVEIDEHGGRIDEFLRIYDSTMKRREADDSYRFPKTFFEALHGGLAGYFAYAYVLYEQDVISTELLLVSGFHVYSFLGGTLEEYFELRPNDLLKHEVIRWARSKGKTNYVLGGGALPGDGIERYKRSFAPSGAVEFMTGQRILHPGTYQQLLEARRSAAGADVDLVGPSAYFPAYRMPLRDYRSPKGAK